MVEEIAQSKLHVAIIMDGNGRWAAARGLPRTMGHRAGIDALKRTLKAVKDLPISHLTVYSFSSENWSRPLAEVSELMQLLRFYLRSDLQSLHKEGIRIRVIGERETLANDIVEMIENAEKLTSNNTGLALTIALSYGGRQEITAAVRGIAKAVSRGEIKADAIDEMTVQKYLFTAGIPDPDLVIRTSGEKRISNFLLWQSAYAEYVFTDVLWPDFSATHLAEAIDEYHMRERRYGATGGNSLE
ncbi:MAG: isoprenyl transferase [Alphaproteobacteria bacterium]|nr:isoprenyl transferase [Alphaproteobacteria bacterium]